MDLSKLKKIQFKWDLLALSGGITSLLKPKPAVAAASVTRVACDLGKSKIVAVEVEKSPQGIKLLKFYKAPRTTGTGKEGEALKQFFDSANLSQRKVRISMKGQGVIVRFVQFPQMKIEDLRSAISFEIDQYIPFKAHEVIWDCVILENNITTNAGPAMNVLLAAIRKDDVYSTLQIFQAAGLTVELVDVDALASINALEFFHPDDMKSSTGILDIGTDVSTLSVVHQGKPRFIRDITYGGVDIIKRLRRKLGLTQEQAVQQLEVDRAPTPEAMQILKEGLGDLVSELRVSLNYYLDQIPTAEPIKKLFIEGGGGYHPLVIETLSKDLGFPVEMMCVLDKIQLGEGVDANLAKQNQGILTVALGLCLRES